MLPEARIIHELVVNDCRADLAAVTAEKIVLVEIKSSKDKLSRLARQLSRFDRAAHKMIVVADARWFEEFDYPKGGRGYRPSPDLAVARTGHCDLFRYPRPDPEQFSYSWGWSLRFDRLPEPHAAKLLGLLWKQELLVEAARHRVSCSSRSTVNSIVCDMVWLMTGAEITRAVCRQLRGRHFPEADPAVSA